MRALLDTQVFLELALDGFAGLSSRVRQFVDDSGNELLLSAISITEIAIKTTIGKLTFTTENISQAIDDLQIRMIQFEQRHAMTIFKLPLHHRDPFDRMLIATALSEGVPIISSDREFRAYRGLKVIR